MYATILTVLLVIGQARVDERWEKWQEEVVVVAETIWTHAVDGDFNHNPNWTNQTPDATHTPGIFDGTTQLPPTLNLDRSAGGGFHLITTPAYRGGLGSSGTPVKWNGLGGRGCTIRGSGEHYLHMVTGNNADAIIDTPGTGVTLDGEVFTLLVKAGNVTIQSTCNLLTFVVVNGNQSNLTIEEADTTEVMPTILRVEGGIVTARRTWSNGVSQQALVLAGQLDITGLLRTETDIHVLGGVTTYVPLTDPSGESPSIYATGAGIFDARGYAGSIPVTRAISGRGGMILGTVTDTAASFLTYNLDDPYP